MYSSPINSFQGSSSNPVMEQNNEDMEQLNYNEEKADEMSEKEIEMIEDKGNEGGQQVDGDEGAGHFEKNHFIDSDWVLQKYVLNFCNVPPPHTGVIIADALNKCFIDWGIKNKVSSITVDNASYNDVCIRRLREDFSLRKRLSIGEKKFHVRCCVHILNLLVQDGLGQLGGMIDVVREEIKWNSTYLMLASDLEFKDVFPRYANIDPEFHYVPTDFEWMKVEEVCKFLRIFHEFTDMIFGSEYPTANIFLVELYRIKDLSNEKVLDPFEHIRLWLKRQVVKMRQNEGFSSSSKKQKMTRPVVLTGKEKFHMHVSEIDRASPKKSDLYIYLAESRYACDANANLDVLGWWKGKRLRFPILSRMAADILTVPITTMASESTFSAGGRVIDDRRAFMSVETVQMLLCGNDWIRSLHGLKNKSRESLDAVKSITFEEVELPESFTT
ncbi:zinc finger BED domain-containing protein RICESLEEPER 2-like [Coffea arabica]|uniref:Zinc finger BED domain-containing protein RICESLEEPER 2-like n=1 Tax=Coffea arabica TaxID=13443 RepID=A0A6P6W0Y4_COFAR|nr:zinc finger BED domain-containing protein RICESLEEPER 2-like [Coffea arabica]